MIASSVTYWPFGYPLKTENPQAYRFGFQGQEHDDEWTGQTGSHLAFKYRIHDARIGRFLSIDPLTMKYPHNSPYAFSENRVIDGVELEGLEFLKASGIEFNNMDRGGNLTTMTFSDVFSKLYHNLYLALLYSQSGIVAEPVTSDGGCSTIIQRDIEHKNTVKATKYKVHGTYNHETNKVVNYKTPKWKKYSKNSSVPLYSYKSKIRTGNSKSTSPVLDIIASFIYSRVNKTIRKAQPEYREFMSTDFYYADLTMSVVTTAAFFENIIPAEFMNRDNITEISNLVLSQDAWLDESIDEDVKKVAGFIYDNWEALYNGTFDEVSASSGHPLKDSDGNWKEGYSDYKP